MTHDGKGGIFRTRSSNLRCIPCTSTLTGFPRADRKAIALRRRLSRCQIVGGAVNEAQGVIVFPSNGQSASGPPRRKDSSSFGSSLDGSSGPVPAACSTECLGLNFSDHRSTRPRPKRFAGHTGAHRVTVQPPPRREQDGHDHAAGRDPDGVVRTTAPALPYRNARVTEARLWRGVVSVPSSDTGVDAAKRVSLSVSLVSLFLSGWAIIASLDDDADVRDVERRLACLELPGANDCGLDGR